MRVTPVVVLSTLAVLAACSTGRSPGAAGDDDPFHVAATVAPDPGLPETEGPGDVVRVLIRRVGTGETIAEPRLIVPPGRPATVTVGSTLSYVETFRTVARPGAWMADPVIGTLRSGLALEVATGGRREDGLLLAYRMTLDELTSLGERTVRFHPDGTPGTVQLPRVESASLSGARRVPASRFVRLGRLPDPSGAGSLDVLASVEPGIWREEADVVVAPEPAAELMALLEEAGSGNLRLGVSALRLRADLEPGREIDDEGADAFLDGSRQIRELELTTAFGAASRASVLRRRRIVTDYREGRRIEEPEVRLPTPAAFEPVVDDLITGLVVETNGAAELRVRWTTTSSVVPRFGTMLTNRARVEIDLPEVHVHERVTSIPTGRRLISLARLDGGGTLAVLVDGRR